MNTDKFIKYDDKEIYNETKILYISILLNTFKKFYNFDVNECDNYYKITPLFYAIYK